MSCLHINNNDTCKRHWAGRAWLAGSAYLTVRGPGKQDQSPRSFSVSLCRVSWGPRNPTTACLPPSPGPPGLPARPPAESPTAGGAGEPSQDATRPSGPSSSTHGSFFPKYPVLTEMRPHTLAFPGSRALKRLMSNLNVKVFTGVGGLKCLLKICDLVM